ncbi:MAG: hypothetical protein HOP19_16470 [Acidobacteria bacterium]|nr:hypothetical protein [Acidobacteriota bacterium]
MTIALLSVPHITQIDCGTDEEIRCGAACVEMVLRHLGSGDLESNAQESIFGITHSPPPAFPDQLENYPSLMVEAIRRHLRTSNYQVFWNEALGSDGQGRATFGIEKRYDLRIAFHQQVEAISELIAKTIEQEQKAAIIVVRQANAHWVVVHGVTRNTDSAIRSFFIRNPLGKYRRSTTEIDRTAYCEVIDDLREDYVPYGYWKRGYFPFFLNNEEGITYPVEDPPWLNRFFLICAPTKTALQSANRTLRSIPAPRPSLRSSVSLPLTSLPLKQILRLTPAQAIGFAKDAISTHKLFEVPLWNEVIGPTWTLGQPYLVKQLDADNNHYYLVPVSNNVGKSPVLIRISAADGEFEEATIWAHYKDRMAGSVQGGEFIPYFAQRQALESGLKGKAVYHQGKSYKIKTLDMPSDGEFAWKPCIESFSSFKPFYYFLASMESGDKLPIYVPVDRPDLILTTLSEPKKKGL